MDDDVIQNCTASFYENELVSQLLGDNFHPGGESLTLLIGEQLGLNTHSEVLDVACGPGASAVLLADAFGAHVTGVDLSVKNLEKATAKAETLGLSDRVTFRLGDAQALDLPDSSFDAVISECSLCTFPDAERAVREMFRALRSGGKVAVSDVVVDGEVPSDLQQLLYRAACVAGAKTAGSYVDLLEQAGFSDVAYDDHGYALTEMLEKFQGLLQGWKVIEQLCGCDAQQLFGVTPEQVESALTRAEKELREGRFSYAVFTAEKRS